MATNFFYVYALRDPRVPGVFPFYIGKGTGSRAWDHLVTPDKTAKFGRIKEILAAGQEPIVDVLADDLTEIQAYRIEAQLIAAFGTVASGGPLTNTVLPVGGIPRANKNVNVPYGVVERAQLGLELLKTAIVDLAKANPKGITNADTASVLGLRSDYQGRQKDYLSYSVLGLLLREKRIVRPPDTQRHVANV
jgi:hypothetical protein